MEPTISIEKANQLAEEHNQRSLAALPPEARLELQESVKSQDCSDPSDNGPQGRVLASRSYQVVGLSKDRLPEYFASMRRWWESHNYRVLDDQPMNEYLWVENNADGFRMSLQVNDLGELYIGADSPCVWPKGTPEPRE